MKKILPILLIITIVASCSREEELFFDEPNIKVQFFNIDSLLKLNETISVIDDSIIFITSQKSIWSDSIKVLNDTINSLTDLIETGEIQYEQSKVGFEEKLSILLINVAEYDELDQALDSVLLIFNDRKLDVTSGKMLLTTLRNKENGESLSYADSMNVYSLPLSMTTDATSYNLEIDNNLYVLDFEYKRTNKVDDKSRVTVLVYDIGVSHHTFDSIYLFCNTNSCENDEASIQVFF